MRRVSYYLVTREHATLGYKEFFGPLPSTSGSIHHDARRLYGKPGYRLSWRGWSKAPKSAKNLAEQNASNVAR